MRYVLDSCVALKWIFIEEGSTEARRLRDDYLNPITDLLAPDVFPVEIAHSVTRAERAGRISTSEGEHSMKNMLTILPSLESSLLLLPRAYELSSKFRIGVYDCLYVALAEQEGCQLVTADQRLIKALPHSPIISLELV